MVSRNPESGAAPELERQCSDRRNAPGAQRYYDTVTGNINVIQNVDDVLLRITAAADEFKIISVGPIRPNGVTNGINQERALRPDWRSWLIMASVHITEIQKWLRKAGQTDALPGPGGMFLEIRFDVEGDAPEAVDEEFADKVLTVDSPSGLVTIVFDSAGQLRSLDIS